MRLFSRSPSIAFALALYFFAALSLEGQSLLNSSTLSFRGGIMLFTDNGNLPDPMPVLPSVGVAADFGIFGPLRFEASLDFYGTDYDYSYPLSRAVPASIEYRSSFVVGFVLGFQALGRFDLTPSMALRVFGGPGVDLRACFLSYNLNQNDIDENSGKRITSIVDDIAVYFWDSGRWFLPTAGIGFDYRILPKLMLGIDGRVWFPLYRAWSGEDLAPLEGWRFSLGFKITLR